MEVRPHALQLRRKIVKGRSNHSTTLEPPGPRGRSRDTAEVRAYSSVMKPMAAMVAFVWLPACAAATPDPQIEARLDRLERAVAELNQAGPVDRIGPPNRSLAGNADCSRDTSTPSTTQFNEPVKFELGRTDLRGGDRIAITEVRGTRGDFKKGGSYLVRGEYTLASAEHAQLGFSVTVTNPEESCSHGDGRESLQIDRGTGKFELVETFVSDGHPHVSFYVNGQGSGGVYFGADAFLLR